MNIAGLLSTTAARQPGHPALRLGDATLDYRGLDGAAARVAGFLRARGVGPGDRVAIMLPNLPQFAAAYYGILRLGAVVVPMNPLLKRREVAFLLRDSGAGLIFTLGGFDEHPLAAALEVGATCVSVGLEGLGEADEADPVDAVASRAGNHTAVLQYTSGTTGTPKGAELTHAGLRRNYEISGAMFAVGPADAALGALPLFHSFGQTCMLNTAMSRGACLSLLPRFEPGQALQTLAEHGVTICAGVPTMYQAMLDHPDAKTIDTSRLRVLISGGSAMPVKILEACERTFGSTMLEGYGLSETSPVASFNQPGHPRKPGSIGTPIEGIEMRVVDESDRDLPVGEVGEILIRGHNLMKGYFNEPEATAVALKGGWMHTGDLARVDQDGYYFIVDRKKDMVLRGGLNVYSREVEDILLEHPDVAEAAVVAVPHPLLGEDVGAAVVLRAGATVTARELRTFVRDQIATYKHPRRLWFVDALPKGPAGKVLKREIRIPEAG